MEEVDIKKLEKHIRALKANKKYADRDAIPHMEKALAEAEKQLAEATKDKATNGLKPAKEEAGPSAFFKGVKTAGKKTRRVKHRKRHTRRV